MTQQHAIPPSSRRLRSYVLWSYVVVYLVSPLWSAISVASLGPEHWHEWPAIAHLVMVCIFSVLATISAPRIMRYGLDGTPRLPVWLLPILTALAFVSAILGSWVGAYSADSPPTAALPVVSPLITLSISLSLILSSRANYLIAMGIVLVGVAQQGLGDISTASEHMDVWLTRMTATGISITFFTLILAASFQWTMSVLRSVDTQSKEDAIRADLAAAEERLRIARDLHDVFGRTLTAVAVKSDLAAALAENEGAPRAAAESRRIRDLAEEALKEVRAVLAGYRRPELSQELAGAHSLLSSAGARVHTIGDPDTLLAELPAQDRERIGEAAAMVVRESGTNIVRHAEATHATFRLDKGQMPASGQDAIILTVTNNGVCAGHASDSQAGEEGAAHTPGSGLDSMAARLEKIGGTLTWKTAGDTFTVTAHLATTHTTNE